CSSDLDRPSPRDKSGEAEVSDERMRAADVRNAPGVTSTSDDERLPGPGAVDEPHNPHVDSEPRAQDRRTKQVSNEQPRKYKGLSRATARSRDAQPEPRAPGGQEPTQRRRSLPIEVRLRFDRGGFCIVSLIARRSEGLPESLTAVSRGASLDLRAM